MATWTQPTANALSASTYIKDTDNKLQSTMDDLQDYVNATGSYVGAGLVTDFVDKTTAQAITSVKTIDTLGAIDFTNGELRIGSVAVTSTATEINLLDGVTATTAELNLLDGVTSTTAELNILDGVTSTTAELNILDGVTATASELNILDGVTATTTELNILDGVTATTAELNYLDGATSAIQAQMDLKAPLASPALTGTPTVPTAGAGTDTTQAASTEFVQQELDSRGKVLAWINFNGATVTASADLTGVRGSDNITSLVDNGTGDYTANLTTALPSVNVCPLVTQGNDNTINERGAECNIASTTAVNIQCYQGNSSSVAVDSTYVSMAVIG